MTTAEARRLFTLCAIPFFLGTALFLILRDLGGYSEPAGAAAHPATPADSAAGGHWLVSSPTHTLQVPDEYWQPAQPASPDELARAVEEHVLQLTNEFRQSHQLPPVGVDSTIADMARAQAREMATMGYFGGTSPGGLTATQRARRDCSHLHADLSWNLSQVRGIGSLSPEETAGEIMDGWKNSAGNRAILLAAECDTAGIGVWHDSHELIACQGLARPILWFDPPLPIVLTGKQDLAISGTLAEPADSTGMDLRLTLPPATADVVRRLGYRPPEERRIAAQWLADGSFRATLPCQRTGIYSLRVIVDNQSYEGHYFRLD